jgi:hypothetical protein
MLRSAEPETLPIILRFLLQSLSSDDVNEVAKSLRVQLNVESLTTSSQNDDAVALLIGAHVSVASSATSFITAPDLKFQ